MSSFLSNEALLATKKPISQSVTITGGNPLYGIENGSIVLEVGEHKEITGWKVREDYVATTSELSEQNDDGIQPRELLKWYITEPKNMSENIDLVRDSIVIEDAYGDIVVKGIYRASLTHVDTTYQPFINFDTQLKVD